MREAFYDENSESTCRIGIDLILIQCRKYLRRKNVQDSQDTSPVKTALPSTPAHASQSSLSVPQSTPNVSKRPVKLFPECTVSVEVKNPALADGKFLVSGRADWALGYSTEGDEGALLVAVEAKQRTEIGSGEPQLLAYLAILRENRRKAGKTNAITQGFYTDGTRFAFMCLKDDGEIVQSDIYAIGSAHGLKMIYSFIVNMLDTAMKSTPTATPTKPGAQQEKVIHEYDSEVWSKVFKDIDDSLSFSEGDDDVMEDIFSEA